MAVKVTEAGSHPSPAVRRPAVAEPTLGDLVATASRDISLLVRQELELAKAELSRTAVRAGLGAAFLSVAGVLGLFAFVAITICLGETLVELGLLRPWAYLIVAGVYLALAGLLALFAKNRLSGLGPPQRTAQTVKDDIAWIKHPTVAPTPSAAPRQ
jgi:hypothetical protein